MKARNCWLKNISNYVSGKGIRVMRKQRKFNFKRQTAFVLILALLAGSILSVSGTLSVKAAGYGISNPRLDDNGVATWDCIWFGNYWQEDTNRDGKADRNDEKTPIKWRVLSVQGNDAFLMADKNLDCQKYNNTEIDITWETCTLRSWLNGYGADKNICGKDYSSENFIDEAFSAKEQKAIKTTDVVNDDNPQYGTTGGNNTKDKVYLLSAEEVAKEAYGLIERDDYATNKRADNTLFTRMKGVSDSGYGTQGCWWLRSPGYNNKKALYGSVGVDVNSTNVAVRPVLHLNLSEVSGGWSSAGTVTANRSALASSLESYPTQAGDTITWECVWFGNYWQKDTNGDGKTDKNDAKTPIKWRVLSVRGNNAFLLADKCLDRKEYNEEREDVTWETCTMRSWLNGYASAANVCGKDYRSENFIDEAFTGEEQEAIWTTKVENKANADIPGGKDTFDQVYLLSIEEVTEGFYYYGLDKKEKWRKASSTSFLFSNEWWLRSPGASGSTHASFVMYNGAISTSGTYYAGDGGKGVRPVLHLDLSCESWAYAGTVNSDGGGSEIPISGGGITPGTTGTPTPKPTSSPTQEPTAEPTQEPTQKPTAEPTAEPTQKPTAEPTQEPTAEPTQEPTAEPTQKPTAEPTAEPTQKPTAKPTQEPTAESTPERSPVPTIQPTPPRVTTPAPQITYDLKVKTSGNGAVTLKTLGTTVTTENNAFIDMKVNAGEDILFAFQPAEESGSYTFIIDGEEQQAEGDTYRIPAVQSSHTVVVTFAGFFQPTQEPTPATTSAPGSPEIPVPTGMPTSSEVPLPTILPAPSGAWQPQLFPQLSSSPAPTLEASKTSLPEEDISAITDGLGVSADTAVKIQAVAKELDVSMDTILVTEQTIQSQKTDEDIKGAYFVRIQAKASQITEKNIKLTWNRVKGADGYEVYGNRCNTKKWIYEYKLKKDIKNGDKKTYIDRKCKKGTYYKYIVRAYKIIDGKKVTIAASKTIHVTTNGGKNGNAESVKVNKNKVTMKVGKTWKIKAKEIKESRPLRHHREVSYESSSPQAVPVSKKGVIEAKKKGKYTIFAYAQSGVYKKIHVWVK